MAGILKDHRFDRRDDPIGYMVAIDKILSGWGLAPVASYVAYPVYQDTSREYIDALERWMLARDDFIHVRYKLNLPRLSDGKHCSVYDQPSIDQIRHDIG